MMLYDDLHPFFVSFGKEKHQMSEQFSCFQFFTLKQQMVKSFPTLKDIKHEFRIVYIDQEDDHIDIVHDKDLQIFVQMLRQKELINPKVMLQIISVQPQLRVIQPWQKHPQTQKQQEILQQRKLKFPYKKSSSIIFDNNSHHENIQNCSQLKNQRINIYQINCHTCKQQIRKNKFICILRPNVFYCENCNYQRKKDNVMDIAMKLQIGQQTNIKLINQLQQQEKQIFKSLKSKFRIQSYSQNSTELYLLQLDTQLKKCQILINQLWIEHLQESQNDNQARLTLPNSIKLTHSDVTQINMQKSVLQTMKNQSQVDQKQAKQDFLRLLKIQFSDINIDNFLYDQKISWLQHYSDDPKVYKNINMALKNMQVFIDSQKLGYLRYPICKIYNQTKSLYLQNIENSTYKYLKQLKLFHGGIMSDTQFKSFRQNIGQMFQIHGFLSCSLSEKVAQSKIFRKNSLIQIVKPKHKGLVSSSGYIYMDNLSKHPELEVLFNIDSKFKILEAEIKKDAQDKEYFYVKMKYLQIPQIELNTDKNKILRLLELDDDCLLLQNLQHLHLISKSIQNQGDCFKVQGKYDKAILYEILKRDKIIQHLHSLHKEKLSQECLNLQTQKVTLQLSKVFNNVGEIYKLSGYQVKSQIYFRRAQAFISQVFLKILSPIRQFLNNQIKVNFHSYLFNKKQILTFKNFNLKCANQNKFLKRISQSAANLNNAFQNPVQCSASSFIGRQMMKTVQFGFSIFAKDIKQSKSELSPLMDILEHGVTYFTNKRIKQLKQDQQQEKLDYQKASASEKARIVNQQYEQLKIASELFNFFDIFAKSTFFFSIDASNLIFQTQYYQNIDLKIVQNSLIQTLKSLQIDQVKNFQHILKIYTSLFFIFQHRHQFKQAQTYLQKLEVLIKKYLGDKNCFMSELYDYQTLFMLQQQLCFRDQSMKEQDEQNYANIRKTIPFAELIQLCQKSFQLKAQLFGKTHSSLGVPLNNLGVLYHYMSQYHKSLQYLTKSLNKLNQNELLIQAQIYYNIGIVHKFRKQPQLAQFYIKKGIDIKYKALQMQNLMDQSINNLMCKINHSATKDDSSSQEEQNGYKCQGQYQDSSSQQQQIVPKHECLEFMNMILQKFKVSSLKDVHSLRLSR